MVGVGEIPEGGVHAVGSCVGEEGPVRAPCDSPGVVDAVAVGGESGPELSRLGVVDADRPAALVDEDGAAVGTGPGACTGSAGLEELAPFATGLGVPYSRLALVGAGDDTGAV